ncbi:hypothetical protein JZ785_17320 [Alicyclobacillus curvatus]|nr:hypothetical protein JZ785_17320 [Alicyclobacillus curvatus]
MQPTTGRMDVARSADAADGQRAGAARRTPGGAGQRWMSSGLSLSQLGGHR